MSTEQIQINDIVNIARHDLTQNLLPFWIKYAPDTKNGGFYGELKHDGSPNEDADKFIVLNARLLWVFSAAAMQDDVTQTPELSAQCIALADRAYDYIMTHFRDTEHGGVFSMLHANGVPKDTNKLVYGISFVIYAMSEYYRFKRDQNALDFADQCIRLLEAHAKDPVHGGFKELLTQDWQLPDSQRSDVNPVAGCTKTMNTHLHLLEAYTNRLRARRDEVVAQSLQSQLQWMLDHIIDPNTAHFKMFLTDDWTTLSDDISPGHDIEGSWLMVEAADVLGDSALWERVKHMCCRMTASCIEYFDADGSMYQHVYGDGRIDMQRSWWVQNEAVVGYINAWEITGDGRYLKIARRCLEYIQKHMIDSVHGGWFAAADEEGKAVTTGLKASAWICPYHNARMDMEIITRMAKRMERMT